MARRKQKQAAPAPDPMNPLEQYAAYADEQARLNPDPQPEPQDDPKLKAQEARIAALSAQIESLERANAAMMNAPMVEPKVQAPPAPPALDMSGLPDPTTQPEEYAKAVNERIAGHVKAHADYQRQITDTNAAVEAENRKKYDELWDDFNIAYDEYADDPKKVQFAASEVIERAKKRGIDVQRYVFGNREKFFADVVKEFDTIFGGDEGPGPGPGGGDEPALRTGGVFGGGSGDPGTSRRGGADKPSSLTAELQAEQRKMRLF